MLNTVILAATLGVTLVVSNVIVTLVMMKLMLNPKFLRKYSVKVQEAYQALTNTEEDF